MLTVNRKVVVLRSFYEWLRRVEVVKENPLDFVKSLKQPKTLPKYLTEEQQKALLQASNDGSHHHPNKWGHWLKNRDRLMILLLLDTGLRISELCAIKKTDIDLEEGSIRIFGKGAKERFVILSDRCISAIRECLKNGNGSDEILFFNQQKRHLTKHAPCLPARAGNRRKGRDQESFGPHWLRHSFATNLRRKGADLLLIKETMGTCVSLHHGNLYPSGGTGIQGEAKGVDKLRGSSLFLLLFPSNLVDSYQS